ncbi:hypothetical protein AeNC1_008153 [Aphanomyces euteiches]|nr:hypothetical protein AeNC1_008153 [Aphanomyces euteiches]
MTLVLTGLIRGAWTLVWLVLNLLVLLVYEVAACSLRPFSRSLYRRAIGRCFALYVEIMARSFPKCDLIVSGDMPTDTSKPVFIIANHQVDADWWYLSELMRCVGAAGNLKIAMKHTLRSLPLVGWGMEMNDFLFLHRDIKLDRPLIQAHMQSFVQDDFPFWMLLFPEGTTIYSEYVTKSHEFAQQQKRPRLHRVLLPRTTGLKLMLESFKDSPIQPEIYDITMGFPGYSGEVPTYDMFYDRNIDVQLPTMNKLFMGQGPSKVYLHCRRFTMDQVGPDVEQFLDTLWVEKEVMMNEFIEHQCFQSKKDTSRVLHPSTSSKAVGQLWFAGFASFCLFPMLFACYLIGRFLRFIFGGIKIIPKTLRTD